MTTKTYQVSSDLLNTKDEAAISRALLELLAKHQISLLAFSRSPWSLYRYHMNIQAAGEAANVDAFSEAMAALLKRYQTV